MYGTPYSEFELKGKVTDANNYPVANAQIALKEKHASGDLSGTLTDVTCITPDGEKAFVLTDTQGNYTLSASPLNTEITVVCTPPAESGLTAVEKTLTITYVKDSGVSSFGYIGSWSGTLDFKLK